MVHGGVEHVLGPADHHVDRALRRVRAVGHAQRRLMEHEIDAARRAIDRGGVADVGPDHRQASGVECGAEMLDPALDEVVEHDDPGRTGGQDLVGDVRADESRPAGDQDVCPAEKSTSSSLPAEAARDAAAELAPATSSEGGRRPCGVRGARRRMRVRWLAAFATLFPVFSTAWERQQTARQRESAQEPAGGGDRAPQS